MEGVSEKWLKDYSQSMLKKIAEFCQSRGGGSPVIMDVLPTSVNPQPHEQVVKVNILLSLICLVIEGIASYNIKC